MLDKLIMAAYAGPVFGPNGAFGVDAEKALPQVKQQITRIAGDFNTELSICIKLAWPDSSSADVARILQEIGPKAVGFCPALTVGELTGADNTKRLGAAASAIGVMYFADQSMDRGDETMVDAIELLVGTQPRPKADDTVVLSKLRALGHISTNIDKFALAEDRAFVLECYDRQVLANEVLLHKKSLEYAALPSSDQYDFLGTHAQEIAEQMVVDAGFPSVSASLYAIYRQNDKSLPPLQDVHGNKTIQRILRICNMVVRVADELGDWQIDAGHHPEWGVFAINPLNQYHPDIVAHLCKMAEFDENKTTVLQDAFKGFHDSETARIKHTDSITEILFDHARQEVQAVSADVAQQYEQYLTLCKRVLEIGRVNMMGDKALAGL